MVNDALGQGKLSANTMLQLLLCQWGNRVDKFGGLLEADLRSDGGTDDGIGLRIPRHAGSGAMGSDISKSTRCK